MPSRRVATPMLMASCTSPVRVFVGSWVTRRRRRSATPSALGKSVSGNRTRNSSPPKRARMSSRRSDCRQRSARANKTWSPIGCPKVSLMRLKWSISIIKADKGWE